MTHPHQLTDADAVKAFTFAGNARITLVSKKTGERFTYQVRAPRDATDDQGPAAFFVSLLSGPQNDSDYTYLGFFRRGQLDGQVGFYEHGKKSRVGADAPSAKAFRWFAAKVLPRDELPDELEVWHEGRCAVCARVLTTPESLTRGIGPECWSKMGG